MSRTHTRNIHLHFLAAVLFLLTGCLGTQKSTKTPLARNHHTQPGFIEDLTLDGQRNCITLSQISRPARAKSSKIKPAEVTVLQEKYADMMHVLPQSLTEVSVYQFINDWLGVRYRLGGNDKNGIDCSAFVQRFYEEVYGVNLVRTAFEQFNLCSFVMDTSNLKEGDLVFFRTRGKRISHVGIYLVNGYFVHASRSRGVMISSIHESYWTRLFAGAGKIPVDQG